MRRMLGVAAIVSTIAAMVLQAGVALANTPVNGAAFTTTNTNVDGTGHCKNGNEDVNCNIYDGKDFVWLNGGPETAYVGDGDYFFAVLDPGGQGGNQSPNDGTPKNLSDDFDAYTNRTFSVSGAVVTYGGSHDFDSNKIRLMPYADTTNPGGVYILAICSLADGYPVDPSDCKYDAFKIQEEGEAPPSFALIPTKDANGSYTNTFTWQISKDVDKTKVTDSDGSATFNYTVTVTHDGGTITGVKVEGTIDVFNPNVDSNNDPVSITGVDVTDQLSDGTVCTVAGGSNATLAAGDFSTPFSYECDLATLPQGQLKNTATVTWPDQFLDNGAFLDGGTATFTFPTDPNGTINFAETTVDDCVNVTDTLGGDLGTVCVGDANPTSFNYSNTVEGTPGTCVDQDNTATFTTDDTGTTDSASRTVTLCTPADLTVSKTAAPAFTRTYNWDIAKSANKTLIRQLSGSVTVTYTITVTQKGHTDSGWSASGSVTVANPNDFEAVSGIVVTDAVNDANASCSVDQVPGGTLAAGASATLAYTCSWSAAPASNNETNTATVTWDASAQTPTTTASGTAPVNFDTGSPGNPTEVNKCVTITDSYAGTLGTDCVGVDPVTKTFTYNRTFTVTPNACVTYDNTATIVQTGQQASASVKICGGVAGGLTMGFWQNKNGQGIITGGSSTGGVCNSGTWLRQYAPFQDLSPTATCAQVATYVFNTIKAANAGGATMNKMLKGQMLATALDVYFSDPALGGNKIKAPAPLGGIMVDLTQICKMIDSQNGTGTCSGQYSNTSSAFGGTTCQTVSQLLAYAASQSNVGGTAWYGNVKATQELAKNTFDAINNAVAFTC